MKTVFVNPERCIGCKQCQIACAVEHSQSKILYQAIFEECKPRPRILVAPGLYLDTSFPNKCRHCDPAPCMTVCPTGAISRDDDTDAVVVDSDKCIACAMCAMVCPFDVITFYPSPNKLAAIKCDQCIERQSLGEIPACVESCKTGALVFGDINELTKTARTELAQTVSVAVGEIKTETARIPAHVEAWRSMGKAVSQVGNKEKEYNG
ncbi:MAG: 4Fe-4S dicluster domain-containing protein [Chloroflexota bacterium]|nr:4Fe-4S dicluster domain-containing protein [Chloroflexota bacterium]